MVRPPESLSRQGWHTEESRGAPLDIARLRLTPVERVTKVGWRGVGLTWRRPVFVEVRQENSVRRVPIYNQTRRAVVTVVVAELVLGVVGLQMWRGASRRKRAV